MNTAALFTSFAKYSVEVEHPDNVAEAVATAFQRAMTPPMGAAVVSLPYDVMAAMTSAPDLARVEAPSAGAAPPEMVERAAARLEEARLPLLLLGARAGSPAAVDALHRLLAQNDFPVVETFQSAGALSRQLLDHFVGRVGLFRNQPGDVLLSDADVIVTVGYDPVEYDPELWNVDGQAAIIHIDELPASLDAYYQPEIELLGGISATLDAVSAHASKGWRLAGAEKETLNDLRQRLKEVPAMPASAEVVHPTQIVATLRELLPDETVIACDIGSNYVWMARHFHSFEPHRLLFSNGQQTLGVALPWAIAASLVEPGRKAVSVSGDGGFGFSAMELETAVRLQSELVHLVWCDGTYDMVASQQRIKYGRASGTDLGPIDFVAFARSFGATGMRVTTSEELRPVLESALATPGPVIVEIPVDYSHNSDLFATVHDGVLD